MAATLSPGVDALLRRSQLSDLSRSLVLESCATAAIEEVCDRGEAIIRQRYPGRALTSRYSPGYGDLPVTVQGASWTCWTPPGGWGSAPPAPAS